MKENTKKIIKDRISYLSIISTSILVLIIANLFIQPVSLGESQFTTATVISVEEIMEETLSDGSILTIAFFYAETREGVIVEADMVTSTLFEYSTSLVEEGDRILLALPFDDYDHFYEFAGYVRTMPIYILTGIFILAILIFGRTKGFNALISLGLTAICIFFLFVPAILGGADIRVSALLVCAYVIMSTILIVQGITKKAITAIISCFLAILFAGLVLIIMENILNLTGLIGVEATHLHGIVDLNAVIFAAILIGSLGAVMDVAVSISSALWEISVNNENLSFKGSMSSGINIGKDILGTMLNTLVLAYIGSYLLIVLSLVHNEIISYEFFNRDVMLVEFLRILIGSIGIFMAIPISTFVCSYVYNKYNKNLT